MRLRSGEYEALASSVGSVKLRSNDSLLSITEPSIVGVRGSVEAGMLVGIMGESGCGKTTLLTALAKRLDKQLKHFGSITLNGVEVGERLPPTCSYVPQFDSFLPCLTVTEHLTFQAALRLGYQYTNHATESKVASILDELNLTKVRHSRIGSATGGPRGLSGGEMKRLSVAQELLVDPSLLILDEPTSGLDTFMSEQLVNSLKNLTHRGRSVLCTIHQPSADSYSLFDKIILMKKGQVIYDGNPNECMELFLKCGSAQPDYDNVNPADYILYSLCTEPYQVTEGVYRMNFESVQGRDITPVITGIEYITSLQNRDKSRIYPVWKETAVLCRREAQNYLRNTSQFKIKAVEITIVSVLLGVLYWQIPSTFKHAQSKLGLMFLMIFYWNYTCLISVMPVELFERELYKREIKSSMYCATSYILSKSLVRLPFETLYTFIFMSVIYWMSGLNPNANAYLLFFFMTWLSSQAAVSFGYLTSSISPSFKVAMAIHIPIILPLFITAGLFINANTVPWYLIWCQWISFYFYGYEGMCATQLYSSETFPDCVNRSCPLQNNEEVLKSLGFTAYDVWQVDIPVLVVLVVAYRALALLAIRKRTM